MTATLDPNGHLVLPLEAHRIVKSCPTGQFDVQVSSSGVIMLRPVKKPHRSLVESFQALQGVELSPRRDPIPGSLSSECRERVDGTPGLMKRRDECASVGVFKPEA